MCIAVVLILEKEKKMMKKVDAAILRLALRVHLLWD